MVVETAAKSIAGDDSAGERVSLNNVKVDSAALNLDSTGSTDRDADDSSVCTEADLEEDDNTSPKKRKKISNYYLRVVKLTIYGK